MRCRTSVSHAGHRFSPPATGVSTPSPRSAWPRGNRLLDFLSYPAPVRITSIIAGLGRDSLILLRFYLLVLVSGLRGQATPSELESTLTLIPSGIWSIILHYIWLQRNSTYLHTYIFVTHNIYSQSGNSIIQHTMIRIYLVHTTR